MRPSILGLAAPAPDEGPKAPLHGLVVRDFDVPFWHLVLFLVKLAFALAVASALLALPGWILGRIIMAIVTQ